MNKLHLSILLQAILIINGLSVFGRESGDKKVNPSAIIRVRFQKDAERAKSLSIGYCYTGLSPFKNQIPNIKVHPLTPSPGVYEFRIKNLKEIAYFAIYDSSNGRTGPIFNEYYLVEPGDSVEIVLSTDSISSPSWYNCRFSGNGAKKMECQFQAESAMAHTSGLNAIFDSLFVYQPDNYIDNKLEAAAQVLEKYRASLSHSAYGLLKIDIYSKLNQLKDEQVRRVLRKSTNPEAKAKVSQAFRAHFSDSLSGFNAGLKTKSDHFGKYYILRKMTETWFDASRPTHEINYDKLKKSVSGSLGERLLTILLFQYSEVFKARDSVLKDASHFISDPFYKQIISTLKNRSHGSAFYPFQLSDTKGQMISLNDFRGKVVFVDFWFTGCTPCRAFYQYQLKKIEEQYTNQEVVFVTISVDKSKERWLKSVSSGEYTSERAVNLYTNGMGMDHDIIKYYSIQAFPKPMLINKEGKLFRSATDIELRTAGNLKKQIDKLLSE